MAEEKIEKDIKNIFLKRWGVKEDTIKPFESWKMREG